MEVVDVLQGMLDRFNRKRELHQRAHTLYKNRDMVVFIIPLMVLQFTCGILPQIGEALPEIQKVISIISSALAAISAIWLGFQANKRYGERSESHKNAASIYQYLAVLTMEEKQREKLTNANDEQKLFGFQDMVLNIEGKAKDDQNLVPARVSKAMKWEKELEKKKAAKSETVELKPIKKEKSEENLGYVATPKAVTHLK